MMNGLGSDTKRPRQAFQLQRGQFVLPETTGSDNARLALAASDLLQELENFARNKNLPGLRRSGRLPQPVHDPRASHECTK
jgi:hypothetical protein